MERKCTLIDLCMCGADNIHGAFVSTFCCQTYVSYFPLALRLRDIILLTLRKR